MGYHGTVKAGFYVLPMLSFVKDDPRELSCCVLVSGTCAFTIQSEVLG
jgi:hypothetical protein